MSRAEALAQAELEAAFSDEEWSRGKVKVRAEQLHIAEKHAEKLRDRQGRDLSHRCCDCGSDKLETFSHSPGTPPPHQTEKARDWVEGVSGDVRLSRCRDCLRHWPRNRFGALDSFVIQERLEGLGLTSYWLPKAGNDLNPDDANRALGWAAWELRRRLDGGDLADELGDPKKPFSHLDSVKPEHLDWNPA